MQKVITINLNGNAYQIDEDGYARYRLEGRLTPRLPFMKVAGERPPFVPPAQVNGFEEEMTKAKADWQVIVYGGTVHSFTNPDAAKIGNPALAYNKHADERSWKALTSFFQEIFAA